MYSAKYGMNGDHPGCIKCGIFSEVVFVQRYIRQTFIIKADAGQLVSAHSTVWSPFMRLLDTGLSELSQVVYKTFL